jgi:hypothetical protein
LFVGQYAAAFVAKRVELCLPLWALLLAVQIVDVFWAICVLTGIEHASLDASLPSNPLVLSFMPYTHSLAAAVVWALAVGVVGVCAVGERPKRAMIGLVLAAAVASHWLLDLLVHRLDLGLLGESHKIGLGLWNYPLLALLEIALLAFGAVLLAMS